MTLAEAIEVAKLGVPVRRDSWDVDRTLVFSTGQGTSRTVALINDGDTTGVMTADDLTQADRDARDWKVAG